MHVLYHGPVADGEVALCGLAPGFAGELFYDTVVLLL